jgi:hypothetical protein
MEELARWLVKTLISMSSKEVTLRLQKVCWEALGPVTVIIRK